MAPGRRPSLATARRNARPKSPENDLCVTALQPQGAGRSQASIRPDLCLIRTQPATKAAPPIHDVIDRPFGSGGREGSARRNVPLGNPPSLRSGDLCRSQRACALAAAHRPKRAAGRRDMAMGTAASDKRRQRLAPSRLALPIARARSLSLKPPQPHRRPNGTPYPAEACSACSLTGKGSGSRDDLTIRTTETRSTGTARKPIDLPQKPGRKRVWISPPFRTST